MSSSGRSLFDLADRSPPDTPHLSILQSGEKDRRPLANVPIVRLSIYEVDRTGHEIKLDEK